MSPGSPSFRLYYAALLDYLLHRGESGLAHAYEMGRTGFDAGVGLVSILHMHYEALHSILESTSASDEFRRRLSASSEFLVEVIAPFEMASQGYRAVVKESEGAHRA